MIASKNAVRIHKPICLKTGQLTNASIQVQSSHKEPEQFTDVPYKAGTCVYHTKNNLSSLLTLHIRLVCVCWGSLLLLHISLIHRTVYRDSAASGLPQNLNAASICVVIMMI